MSKNIEQSTRSILTTPGKGHTTILTTFRNNGIGVSSPVGTIASEGKLYFMTPASTWKVKRLANNQQATVAPGTFKGEALGPAIEGTARRLSGEERQRAQNLLRTGILGRFWNFVFDLRYPGDKTAFYEISLVNEGVDQETAPSYHR